MHKPCGGGARRGRKIVQCDLGEHGHQDPRQGRGAPFPQDLHGLARGPHLLLSAHGDPVSTDGQLAGEEEETRANE